MRVYSPVSLGSAWVTWISVMFNDGLAIARTMTAYIATIQSLITRAKRMLLPRFQWHSSPRCSSSKCVPSRKSKM